MEALEVVQTPSTTLGADRIAWYQWRLGDVSRKAMHVVVGRA